MKTCERKGCNTECAKAVLMCSACAIEWCKYFSEATLLGKSRDEIYADFCNRVPLSDSYKCNICEGILQTERWPVFHGWYSMEKGWCCSRSCVIQSPIPSVIGPDDLVSALAHGIECIELHMAQEDKVYAGLRASIKVLTTVLRKI